MEVTMFLRLRRFLGRPLQRYYVARGLNREVSPRATLVYQLMAWAWGCRSLKQVYREWRDTIACEKESEAYCKMSEIYIARWEDRYDR
jgi:hypothetical protein